MTSIPITSKHYAAIFTVALATIALQILFSRLFSVTFYYHFAFVGITFAMLGLTAGALKVYTQPDRFTPLRTNEILADYATRFAGNFVAAALLHIYVPGLILQSSPLVEFTHPMAAISMVLAFVLLIKAFIQSGICIALLLTRFPEYTSRLYAFDLGGAALGCVVVIALLMIVDPISALLLIAVAVTLVAWRLLPATSTRRLGNRVKITLLILTILSVVQTSSYLNGTPVFRLLWAKSAVFSTPMLFERWNTYSRVAVTEFDSKTPFGWGFAEKHTQSIEQKYLDIDAGAGTILTAFDGDTKKVAYLKDDIINLGYHIRSPESVAVIGIGGGRDILSGLVFGAKHIQGIEINPAIFEALTDKFADFTGHLYKQPGVSFANAEARSYLVSHKDTYDLIQISLIDTWATTAAGGLTLSENKLYTVEAWNDFIDRLNDDGMLAISRWYNPQTHPGEFYRLVAIASDVITSRNPAANPRDHILIANVSGIVTMALSKTPFSTQDIARFNAACHMLHFKPLLTPDFVDNEIVATLASGKADARFYDSLPLDITPSTDDKPFFFHMTRLNSFFLANSTSFLSNINLDNNMALFVLFGSFMFTLVAGLVFIVRPMATIYRTHHIRATETAPHMLYFACIGLGFMLIEISQMQRLMVFLGHPVYGLSVVLLTLLLSSSLGSYSQRNIRADEKAVWLQPAALCIVLLATGFLTPLITEYLKYYGTTARIIASGLLIAPMGFFMGMMFPIGITLAKIRHEALLPWYWGINGAASVFASVLAVIVSLQTGISATFWAGVACYAVCLLATLKMTVWGGKVNLPQP